MTVRELAVKNGYDIKTEDAGGLSSQVTGVYCCDLLSHAMAKVNQGDLWITVHTNLNVIAVASLTEAACVMIPEGIEIERQTLDRAIEKNVAVLSSKKPAAQIAHEILIQIGADAK